MANDVILNGQLINAQVRPISRESMERAEQALKAKQDGFDTIGVRVGGQDMLILSRSSTALKMDDRLRINGQEAQVLFVENEVNTAREGAIDPFKKASTMAKVAGGAVAAGIGIGYAGGSLATIGTAASFSIGTAIGLGTIGVAVGAAAAAGVVSGVGALRGARTQVDETLVNQLSE